MMVPLRNRSKSHSLAPSQERRPRSRKTAERYKRWNIERGRRRLFETKISKGAAHSTRSRRPTRAPPRNKRRRHHSKWQEAKMQRQEPANRQGSVAWFERAQRRREASARRRAHSPGYS